MLGVAPSLPRPAPAGGCYLGPVPSTPENDRLRRYWRTNLTYLAVLLGTALIEVVRRRDTAALASPIALATLHVAWGAGFLLSDGESPEPVVPTLGP